MDIETKIKLLAETRRAYTEAKTELDRLMDKLKQSPEWIEASELADCERDTAETLEAELREDILENFAATGNKKPHPALSVREVTRLEYDADIARAWCTHKLPKALKLDVRLFEKHAKAIGDTSPIEFVNITKEPQATIATDLSDYLVESAADVEIDFDEIKELPF